MTIMKKTRNYLARQGRADPESSGVKLGFRALILASALAFGISAAAADEFSQLQSKAKSQGRVSVIVTGWQAITGDSDSTLRTPGGSNYEALDGDDFVKELRDRGANMQNVRMFKLLPIVAMSIDAASIQTVKDAGDNIELFEDAEMSFQLAQSGQMLRAGTATASGYTGKGAIVVVMDTGVDTRHPFFKGRVVGEACFSDRCPNGKNMMVGKGAAQPFENRKGYYHGTHVAGISAGQGDKASGVAPDAKIIAVNLHNSNGGLFTAGALQALEFVYFLVQEKGLPIASVNMSFGGRCGRPRLKRYYEILATKLKEVNVALVAATGNSGTKNDIMLPACAKDVVSVGSVGKEWHVAKYSNSSALLDLLAPGGDQSVSKSGGILSAMPDAKYAYLQGTSMASPQVAGAFAVLRQAKPSASVDQLLTALKASGRPVTDSNGIARPAIDVVAALQHLGIAIKRAGRPGVETPKKPSVPVRPAPDKSDKDWRPL